MDRQRLILCLRIAVSAVFGILCVVLIALWVRSYWWNDVNAIHIGNKKFAIQSATGRIIFVRGMNTVSFHQQVTQSRQLGDLIRADENTLGYLYWHNPRTTDFRVQIPHWWLVLLLGTLTIVPWRLKGFSLRTLFIATTVIAFVLGLMVVLGR